jgi:hypothetical protein
MSYEEGMGYPGFGLVLVVCTYLSDGSGGVLVHRSGIACVIGLPFVNYYVLDFSIPFLLG